MATRFLKDVPDDDFVNILTATETSLDPPFVVGQRYNAQATGANDCIMVEAAAKPALTTPGRSLRSKRDVVPFIVADGMGIWIRAVGGPGTVVFNDEGV